MNSDTIARTLAGSLPDEQEIKDGSPVISVVVPVVERAEDLDEVYRSFASEISKVTEEFEFLFVVESSQDHALESLRRLRDSDSRIRLFRFHGYFGEAVALDAAFGISRGRFIFTLSAYFQVVPEAFHRVWEALMEQNADLVITRRHPRLDKGFNQLQSRVFHSLASSLAGIPLRDVSCGFRAMRSEVAQSLSLYGDLHRFIPALANKQGFRVVEVPAAQHQKDAETRVYSPNVYFRRLLDTFTLFFLMKFTKKPLRFFATVGATTSAMGFLICSYLTVLKLFYAQSLADRPLLLLGVMLLVAGIQTIAIGLIGELIVYTLARDSKDYQIQKVVD